MLKKKIVFLTLLIHFIDVSITKKILSHINKHGEGYVFTPVDLLSFGTPHSIGMALLRLERKKKIRRLAHGLYDLPKKHQTLGDLTPSPDVIAAALARRDCIQIQPSGAYAANLLRLSDQVPAKIIYLSNASPRIIKIGNQTIQFLKSSMRRMTTAGRISGLVFEALRYIGKKNTTEEKIDVLRELLSEQDRYQLNEDLKFAPIWMHKIIHSIVGAKKA